jgi:ABC-type amino acid transport substrate-binding protein
MRRLPLMVLMSLLAWAAWASLAPQVQAELNWRELRARGALRVGIDPGIQTFSFYDAGGWNGFDADLARELAARLNLQLSSDPVGYDALYDALQTQRVDIVLSAVSPDPTRTAEFAYSHAYFDAGPRVVSSIALRSTAELAHKRVAVSLGSEADRLVRYWERRVPHLQRLPVPDDAAALAALHSNQADAAVVSVFGWAALQADGASDAWHASSLAPRPYVIALRRQDGRLLSEINQALARMVQDGTLEKWRKKWIR